MSELNSVSVKDIASGFRSNYKIVSDFDWQQRTQSPRDFAALLGH